LHQNLAPMKIVFLVISLFVTTLTFAQKDCEFTTNINDSIGSYKETVAVLMHEKVFGGKSTYIFFSLINNDETPLLKMQKIVKSDGFIGAQCLDNQSKIYLQLQNGKIVTLVNSDQESCGNLIRLEDQKLSTRILSANFLFLKGSFEDLKTSPISIIRIRFATETEDIVVKKELLSELTNQTSNPENYFIENINCVVN
jgi:hypothetical protein